MATEGWPADDQAAGPNRVERAMSVKIPRYMGNKGLKAPKTPC